MWSIYCTTIKYGHVKRKIKPSCWRWWRRQVIEKKLKWKLMVNNKGLENLHKNTLENCWIVWHCFKHNKWWGLDATFTSFSWSKSTILQISNILNCSHFFWGLVVLVWFLWFSHVPRWNKLLARWYMIFNACFLLVCIWNSFIWNMNLDLHECALFLLLKDYIQEFFIRSLPLKQDFMYLSWIATFFLEY